jgi:hypothetical protein
VYPLPRLQSNSGLPEFDHSINWPKSETSDFGWRDREGACNKIEERCKNIYVRTLTPSPTLPRKRGREHTECAACVDFAYQLSMETIASIWLDAEANSPS